ncbi:sugar ABC transporter ATP-binding protein [Desertibacillus haloalkaliphilus]|uniref:sugar ABC transporter ATP-binding protein n=1 Tax=Desertibacillus haloalkaliphilus TaxID=1328930 RepID=UPI001C27D02D|nr:sugar ABC transporter ATP-binding protein [Desertibacillus haloalkaliphilus]MBU8906135.1 sugar ABC transporter ATP-binding protein [Desertibacillus haloalkaliphilus]
MSLLEISQLNKHFGGNHALKDMNLTVQAGEVHSLVGENGAGKSTIIKIISGVYQPSNGTIKWENERIDIHTPRDAQRLGINVIHQDRQLVPYFTGLENLFLNQAYPKKRFGFGIDWAAMKKRAATLQEEWGIHLPLSKVVSEMSPSEKTLLEILRAMMMESKLLILDEPTASLTNNEAELLFSFIKRLKEKGVSVIYISHRLEEVIELSDTVTVLIGGQIAKTLKRRELSKETIIKYMTDGKAIKTQEKINHSKSTEQILLSVKGLTTKDRFVKDIDFDLHKGEILGIYGLAGAGRTELLEAIYGQRKLNSGCIQYESQLIENPTPRNSIEHGVVLIPENRHEDALIMGNTIRENMTISILDKFTRNGVIQKKRELNSVERELERFQVKTTGSEQVVSELSGGNQQKIVFAKALLCQPNIFLCDEPTQAVDIMTRSEIHHFLREQAADGKGIIFVSSDLPEVLEISDRIIVMSEGEIVAQSENHDLQPDRVLDICYRYKKEVI